jgi:hypothetical protein
MHTLVSRERIRPSNNPGETTWFTYRFLQVFFLFLFSLIATVDLVLPTDSCTYMPRQFSSRYYIYIVTCATTTYTQPVL